MERCRVTSRIIDKQRFGNLVCYPSLVILSYGILIFDTHHSVLLSGINASVRLARVHRESPEMRFDRESIDGGYVSGQEDWQRGHTYASFSSLRKPF